jgi:capsular polysaccharide biosynthesis protein
VNESIASPAQGNTPGLAGFLLLVRRWRWMLVAATVAAAFAGYVTATSHAPEYEAHVTLLVGPITGESDTLRAAGQLAETYAALATSRPQLEETGRRLHLRDVGVGMSASASPVTRLLTVRVRQRDAVLGARIANAHAETLVELAAEPQRGIGSGRLKIVEPAVPGLEPIGPPALAIALLAGFAGLIGALLLAFLMDRWGETVKSIDDLEAVTGVACVGSLSRPALRGRADRPVVERDPRSRAAGEYRLLAAKVDATGRRSLLILALDGDGGLMAANLAAALAAGGSDVALVDVGGRETPAAARVAANGTGANGNGHAPPEPAAVRVLERPEIGERRRMSAEAALEGLEGEADVVVLHAPALQRSPRALAWARAADGTLLVAQRDRTVTRDLRATVETLHLVRANLLGTVLAEPPPLKR